MEQIEWRNRSSESPPPAYDVLYPESPCQLAEHLLTLLHISEKPYNTFFTRYKVWPEGEGCYHGELDWKGRRAGDGRMVWGGGDLVYKGRWEKNMMEGEGVMVWVVSGTYYSGGWRKGLMHGRGRLVYGQNSGTPDDVYWGQFR